MGPSRGGGAGAPRAATSERTVEPPTSTGNERRWRRGLFRGGSSVAAPHATGWKERHWTSRALHRVGEVVGHSNAGLGAGTMLLIWAVVGVACRFPDWWETGLYAVTAAVTFVMVFVIQHTQSRQISAMQRKLDELLRSHTPADDALIAAEEAPDTEIQALTDRSLADRSQATGGLPPPPLTASEENGS
jgi:low affinity Fe/Cu permease